MIKYARESARGFMIHDPAINDILYILRQSLYEDDTYHLPDNTRLIETEKELELQGVLSLCGNYLLRSDLSNDLKFRITAKIGENLRTFHRIMRTQTELLELLNTHQIRAVVLKGAAVARYYPRPELRKFGDVDLLVSPEDIDRTSELLLKSGYIEIPQTKSGAERHLKFFDRNYTRVEIHRQFSDSLDGEQNALLDGWLFEGMSELRSVNVCDYTAQVLPEIENGLVLLSHINHHLSDGVGLRQIVDWMMYVRSAVDDSFWNNYFKYRAEAVGLTELAKTAAKLCKTYLDLPSEITWCDDADDELVDGLLLYVMKKGDLSAKISKDSRMTLGNLHHFCDPSSAFRYLTSAGTKNMELAGLKPIKSVAWLYQSAHLARMYLRRKGKKNVIWEFKTGMAEAELLKRLKSTKQF